MPRTQTAPASSMVQRQRGRRRRGAGPRYMKKVSNRGAYKKNVKNQMATRRAPIVETKQRVHSDIATINGFLAGDANLVNPLNWRTLVTNDAFTLLPLLSYYRNSHGFNEWNTIGHNIFSKFLNLKVQLRFPQDDNLQFTDDKVTPPVNYTARNKMIEDPTKVYLVCGWITQSMNYPVNNSPSPSLPAQTSADVDSIETYITQQLKPFFDDDEDKLQFRPKQTTNIKIEKYVQLKPKIDSAIATRAQPRHQFADSSPNIVEVEAHGSIPEVMKSHSWKCMKKIALTEGKEASFSTDKQNLYPNNSWLPFAVIYNPNYEQQAQNVTIDPATGRFTQVQFMEYRWNDAHYFTDS